MRRRAGSRGRVGRVWLALAAAAGLLAALLTLDAAGGPPAPEAVLVARADLRPGDLVGSEAVTLLEVPAGVALPGVLREPGGALGRRAAAPVAAGEVLTEAALGGSPGTGPAPLRGGERAVGVPLSAAGGAAAVLGWGARVDVVASTGEGLAGRSDVVVRDAEVLAVTTGDPSAPAVGGEVLLRVGARQALRLTAAINFAREVRLLVRPAGPDASGEVAP